MCVKSIDSAGNESVLVAESGFTIAGSFLQRGTEAEPGAQIDLLLDRNDRIVNLFEIKFYEDEFSLTEDDARSLRQKATAFRNATGTRKHVSIAMVSPFGIKHNKHSLGLVDNVLTLNDLF